ncbi:MAG: carbohydrate ABC transporter permease [Erysipelotrichaceae bacterium]
MKQKISKLLVYMVLGFGAIIMIFPFYWMITGAFKTSTEILSFPPSWIPDSFLNFDNFIFAFQTAPFFRYFINSCIVTIACVSLCMLTTILAAFAFSRLKFKGKTIIFSLLLTLMMVPFEMIIITNYRTIVDIGIHDTLLALIIPFTSSIFYVYILKNFFDSIPETLYQSARVDGCSNWKYCWRIMVPIAKPSLVTIMLLNAIGCWNSFLWPMLATNSPEVRTLPFGLYAFMTEGGAKMERMMAASTIVVIPMILLFIFARKHIVNGVARGGIKG